MKLHFPHLSMQSAFTQWCLQKVDNKFIYKQYLREVSLGKRTAPTQNASFDAFRKFYF